MSGQTTQRPRLTRRSGKRTAPPPSRARTSFALSWSGGKDSALTLWTLRGQGAEPEALITTVTDAYDRISMHGVRRELLARQVEGLGIPLVEIVIPPGCPNAAYDARMARAFAAPPLSGVEAVAFGDLFLEDVRAYREARLAAGGKRGFFPLWGRDTGELAREFIAAGFEAIIVCLDPRALDPSFCRAAVRRATPCQAACGRRSLRRERRVPHLRPSRPDLRRADRLRDRRRRRARRLRLLRPDAGVKRVVLLSDIHGNAVALEAVLADIGRRGADEIVCLGDVAAGGPQPREALERLRRLGCSVVRGNADDWLLGRMPAERAEDDPRLREIVEWAREQLMDADVAYLESFLPTIELDLGTSRRMLCFHGSPRANSERLLATTPEEELARLFAGAAADVLAGGHTHLQFARRLRGSLLVNPGSVGLALHADADARLLPASAPRLPRFAEYALVEADGAIGLELRRVPIDVAALERAGLRSGMPYPDWWAAGLARRIARRNALAAPDRTEVRDADLLASS